MNMLVAVPTAGRPEKQTTSDALVVAGVHHIVFEQTGDNIGYVPGRAVYSVTIIGIRYKRQFILDLARREGYDAVLMLDDDLRFRRREKEAGTFYSIKPSELRELVAYFDGLLQDHAHAGMVDEFQCQHQPRGVKTRGRYNQVLGYNLRMVPEDVRFRLEINEEHDFSLQLQARGLPPAISCEWTKGSRPYARGGCALWRTPEVEEAEHRRLAALWPHLVSVVPAPKALSGYGIRVKWKDAVP